MKLCVKNISIENFLSFKQADIDLTQSGFIQVCGENKNKDDSSTSNGTGKSSIFEAICWALTGETIRGVKKVKNIFSDDGALVDLRFSCDNDEYRVIRTQEHSKYKTNLLIYKNNEDISGKGIRDSEQILENILPDLTSQLIGSVVILGQGLPQRFTNNTPSGRKEVLEKLSKSDFMIEDLKVRATKRKSTLLSQQSDIQQKINVAEGSKKSLSDSLLYDQNQLENLPSNDILLIQLDKVRVDLSFANEQYTKCKEKLDKAKEYRWSLNTEFSQITAEKQNIADKINLKYSERENEIKNKITELTLNIKTLNAEIQRLLNIKDICPTCGQKLIGVIKPDTSAKESELNNLKIELSELQKSSVDLSKEKETELNSSLQDINSRKDSKEDEINKALEDEQLADAELEKTQDSVNRYQAEEQSILTQLNKNKTLRETLEVRIDDEKKRIEQVESEILYNKTELEKINNHLDAVSKMITVLNRDFRGFLLTNIIDYINAKAKVYCKDIFGNEQLNFQIDGNNLLITFRDKQYETLSGGEKQKVDIIIQLSLRDMLCNYLNFRCNIICFDEIFDNCDSLGCQKILNLISTKLPDIQGIYIITHHTDLDIPADAYIKVVKGEDNISYVER